MSIVIEEWKSSLGARERHFFCDDRENVMSGYLFGVNPDLFTEEEITALRELAEARIRSRLLTARRPPSQGGDAGSTPVETTKTDCMDKTLGEPGGCTICAYLDLRAPVA